METIPRSTQCVQQHVHPASQFFTDEELSSQAERVAYYPSTPQPAMVTEAEWARSDAVLVAMEAERAMAERISGPCERCGTQCRALVSYCGQGICGDCAVDLGEVA